MKVAILGYGVEGKASYEYWANRGEEVTIVDQKEQLSALPEGDSTILGADALDQLVDFNLIIRTPQLRPDKIKTNGKIWSATNEFFSICPAPIIGVTGTKGKGTTATLISEILKATGKTVHLVGNIGVPALQELSKIKADDLVVFELSSFQLWDLEKSPETAVVLMIERDHMDVHASMEEYLKAKANIGAHQTETDLMIYHPTNSLSAQVAASSSAQKKRYQTTEAARVEGDKIVIENTTICKVSQVGLIGAHNLENICAAITAAWRYTQDINGIKEVVTSFKGLAHRLEFVRELQGVKYYNDSFSSAAGATVAAIKSFIEPIVLIAGGYEKQADFSELAETIVKRKNIRKVLLIGQTGPRIAALLAEHNYDNYLVVADTDFNAIIRQAQSTAQPGDIVLLSPGAASYDMFVNFYERGEQFKKIVLGLQ